MLKGRPSGWWQRFSAAGLSLGLTLLLQPAHADSVVLDDDFNDPSFSLATNSTGVGGGFTVYTAGGGTAIETNDFLELSSQPNGGAQAVVASAQAIGINAGGTLFDFQHVTFNYQPANTSTANPATDRLFLGVQNQAPAGSWTQTVPGNLGVGFYIEFNSDSIANGTGSGNWDGTSTLFFKDGENKITQLYNWTFDNLKWSATSSNYAPVLDVQLTVGASSVTLNITGDTQGGGQPITYTGSYSGLNMDLLNGLNGSYVAAADQTENPGIILSVDHVVVTELGSLIVETPQISTPAYPINTNVVYAGETLRLTSTVMAGGTPTYRWQLADLSNFGTFTNLPGGNTATLTYPTSGYGDSTARGVILIASYGGISVTSAVVTVSVLPASTPVVVSDIAPTYGVLTANTPATLSVTFSGNNPMTFQWQISQTGTGSWSNVAGATNSSYTISSPTTANAGYYRVIATNPLGNTPSSVGQLVYPALIPPAAGTYGAHVLALHPVAFWQLNETWNPAATNLTAFDASGNGFNGTYLTDAQNAYDNVVGPQSPAYPGFTTGLGASDSGDTDINSVVHVPGLGLNTNTVTIAMWINPSAGNSVSNSTGLFVNRSGGDAAGLGFAAGGGGDLGYWWNNNSGFTYDFESGLYPVSGIWQLVVMVVQTNQTTFYLDYVDAGGVTHLLTANNPVANNVEYFGSGNTFIGSDVNGANANNVFPGGISDVAVWNYDLTPGQILALFDSAIGVAGNPPGITGEPGNSYTFAGNTAVFSATGISGTTPLAYQWQHAGTNLVNNAIFSGVSTNTLTVSNVTASVAGVYNLVITNLFGKVVSSNAFLVIPTPSLVGEWLNGTTNATNFVDLSGYSPAGTHDGYLLNSNGNPGFMFTNDLPPAPGTNASSLSLLMFDGATALVISNSSTLDANYTNTFDDQIDYQFTVACWARNFPVGWSPFVSKWGEGPPYNPPEGGWQLRADGDGVNSCFTVRDNNAGGLVSGNTGNALDDLATVTFPSNDGKWHHYAGTFNANTGVRCLYVDDTLVAQETNNVAYAMAPYSHVVIGGKDSAPGNAFGNFSTNVVLYDVRIYNYALSQAQVGNLVGLHGPSIAGQPSSAADFVGLPATVAATGISGTAPLAYQWTLNGTNIANLADATNFTGGNSSGTLTIGNMTPADAGTYQLTITNLYGIAVSSNAVITAGYQTLVGHWFSGAATLADVSGYQPPGTHDGYDSAGNGAYSFTNDVPPFQTGQALSLVAGTTAIGIMNSSTFDANYTNTFDNQIASAMTVSFWAKGFPSGWNYILSKNGDSGSPNAGWTVRRQGAMGGNNPAWTMRSPGGTLSLGADSYGSTDDLGTSTMNLADGSWHLYSATYNKGAGIRNLYIDGGLVAQVTNCGAYNLAAYSHLVIGGIDPSPGNAIKTFLSAKFYDVRIYNYALSAGTIAGFMLPPPGTPAQITAQPAANQTNNVGWTVQLSVPSGGSAPLTNQWQFNGVNLVDGTYSGVTISGSATTVLTIKNITTSYAGAYSFTTANAFGSANASINLTLLPTVGAPKANIVGEWLNGQQLNFNDVSGYSPTNTHDGILKGAATYYWTNDVPPSAPAGSMSLHLVGDLLSISNTSTLDPNYTNTFDQPLTNQLSVTFWAKGAPGGWTAWVAKDAEATWGVRADGGGNPTWTLRGSGGTEIVGKNGNTDMESNGSIDSQWHFYGATFNATTGIRCLYVDGILVAEVTGCNAPYTLGSLEHLCIGGEDVSPGNSYGNNGYYTGSIYDVRIYNTYLSQAQEAGVAINLQASTLPVLSTQYTPGVNGAPGTFQLTWSTGTLLETTNLLSGWTPVTTTSPYSITTTNAQMFFRVSNP